MRRVQWNALLVLAAVAMIVASAAAASAPSIPVASISPRSLRRLLQAPSRAPRIATPAQVAALDDSEEQEDNATSPPIPDDGEGPTEPVVKPKPKSTSIRATEATADTVAAAVAGKKPPAAAGATGKSVPGPAVSSAPRSAPATEASSAADPPPEEDDEEDLFPGMVGAGLGLQHSETIKIGEHDHEGFNLSEETEAQTAGNTPATGAAAAAANEPMPDVPPQSVPAIPTGAKARGTTVTSKQRGAGSPKRTPPPQPRPSASAGGASSEENIDPAVPVDMTQPGDAKTRSLADEKAALDAQHKKEQEEEEAVLGTVPVAPSRPLPPLPAHSTNQGEEEEMLTSQAVAPAKQPVKRPSGQPSGQHAPNAASAPNTPVAPESTAGSTPAPSAPAAGAPAEEENQPATPLVEPKPVQDVELPVTPTAKAQPNRQQGAKKRDGTGSGAAMANRPAPAQNPVAEEDAVLSGPSAPKSANDTQTATNANSVNKKNLPKTQPKQPVTPAPSTAPTTATQTDAEGEPTATLTDQPVSGSAAPQPDAKAAAAAAAKERAAAAAAKAKEEKEAAALAAKQAAAKKAAAAKEAAAATEAEAKVEQAAAQSGAPAEDPEPTSPAVQPPKADNSEPKKESLFEGEEAEHTSGATPAQPPQNAAAPKAKTGSNSTTTPATTKTGSTSTDTKPGSPAKPVKPAQPAPQLDPEEDGVLSTPSAAAQAAADGSGAVRTSDNTVDPEAAPTRPKTANATAATSTAKLPSCTLSDARLSFVGGDLRLYVKIVQTRSCAVSDDLELRAALSIFKAGRQNRCTHTMRLSSTEIKQASSGDDGYVILSADKTRSMVPEVRYNVEFTSCPALAQSPQECKPVARAKEPGSETLMRPATAANRSGVQAVRLVTSTSDKFRMPFDPLLAGEDLSRSIIESLLQGSPDATASLRSLSVQRLLVSFVDHDDTDDTGVHVHFDVLPMPAGGAFTGETMEAPELAERVRCFLINKTKAQDTAQLKLIGPIVSIEQFDPCANSADAAACAIVRPPVTSTAPEPMPVKPSGPARPPVAAQPSGPTRTAPSVEDEFELDQDSRTPTRPKTPTEPAAPAKTPITPVNEDEVEELVGAASAEELDAARAEAPASNASTGFADQLSELLGGLNPLYAMVLVGAILAVTFWALCLRGGSSDRPRRTETAAMDGPDEELGGVEMARGSSRHGGFAPLQNQDDDSSMSSANQPAPTLASVPSGAPFANEKEEGSASKFLISVLIGIGIPSFGTAKYSQILKDNYLSRLDQLKQLDSGDWKRLGLPFVIEEALRKALLEHTNREGKFAVSGGAGAAGGRAKGLDLKSSAGAKKSTSSVAKDKHKKGGLSVAALTPSPKGDDEDADTDLGLDLDDPFAAPTSSAAAGAGPASAELTPEDNDEPAVRDEPASSSSSATTGGGEKKKKGSKKKKEAKKASLLLAPPANDNAAAAQADEADDSAEKLDDDWMSKF